jgi:hypothetical protein
MASVRSIQAFLLASLLSFSLHLQSEEFSGRLSPSPVTIRTVDDVTGGGQVTARLEENRLNISATFEGLQAAATTAHLHAGKLAIPGPAFAQLTLKQKTAGSVSGVVELNEEDIARLRAGGMYLQINSQVAPEGNLRAWLLPIDTSKRAKEIDNQ